MENVATPQQQIFRYQSFQIDKSQPLGHGAYGAVYKAKCDQLPCAAKILHPTIVDPMDPGADRIMDRFSQECSLLERIRHPNIVQYLAMTVDPESRLPVLLMELLDGNLTRMLERSKQTLPINIQVNLCHDVALAIAYLHSNDIIHRDLSSNNVLIIAGRRAKVTDFGMSKLAGAAPTMTPLTMCPGTLAYMPPEALREPPRYTKKLDCFSEGVIMLQVCTQLWPEPGPRTQLVPDSRSPTGTIEMPVLEIERRKNHIDKIDANHPLLPIAVDCLKYQERERPPSEELCQRLAGLKESTLNEHQDTSMALQIQNQHLMQELQDKDKVIKHKECVIQDKEREIQEKDRVILDKIRVMERVIQDKDRVIASREEQLRELTQQLEEQEQSLAEVQHTNHLLQRQLQQVQTNPRHKPTYTAKQRKLAMSWKAGDKAPFGIFRGAAVVDRNVAYFMNLYGQSCLYTEKKWSELPKYPHQYSSLAIVDGQLTAIGGCENMYKKFTYTNKLLSLRTGFWSSVFPSMPTKRRSTTAVTSQEHLIVAGGATGPDRDNITSIVEVMDTKTLVWSTVASLPHPYNLASATICGEHLFMLGGWDDEGMSKSVLICSLTELLQSSSSSVWQRVADAPAYLSTCATVNRQLLSVGGCNKGEKATSAVYKYSQLTNTWEHISDMPTARCRCLIAVLPTNEMLAVGGWVTLGCYENNVEIARF